VEAADFDTVGRRGDCEDGEASIDAHPVNLVAVGTAGVASCSVEVGSTDVEADIPTASVPADGGEQDRGDWSDHLLARLGVDVFDRSQQPSQPAGVVMHPDRPDGG
jgi:hypothetical protein